jgi:hypothetical protein
VVLTLSYRHYSSVISVMYALCSHTYVNSMNMCCLCSMAIYQYLNNESWILFAACGCFSWRLWWAEASQKFGHWKFHLQVRVVRLPSNIVQTWLSKQTYINIHVSQSVCSSWLWNLMVLCIAYLPLLPMSCDVSSVCYMVILGDRLASTE